MSGASTVSTLAQRPHRHLTHNALLRLRYARLVLSGVAALASRSPAFALRDEPWHVLCGVPSCCRSAARPRRHHPDPDQPVVQRGAASRSRSTLNGANFGGIVVAALWCAIGATDSDRMLIAAA